MKIKKKFKHQETELNEIHFKDETFDEGSSADMSEDSNKNENLQNHFHKEKDHRKSRSLRQEHYLSQQKSKGKLDESILTEKIQKIQNYPKFLEKYNITFKDINPFFDVNE